jgi:hypothetical protein
MKLYHGTNTTFDHIDLTKSRPNKDFGRGFYLSADYHQALDMATFKTLQLGGEPLVHTFEFDERALTSADLHVKVFHEYSQEWADFVITNRTNTADSPNHPYDIVIGPIANDRVGLQIRKYMDGDIDFQTFIRRLKYMKGMTIQYYFGTERAIQTLTKL